MSIHCTMVDLVNEGPSTWARWHIDGRYWIEVLCSLKQTVTTKRFYEVPKRLKSPTRDLRREKLRPVLQLHDELK